MARPSSQIPLRLLKFIPATAKAPPCVFCMAEERGPICIPAERSCLYEACQIFIVVSRFPSVLIPTAAAEKLGLASFVDRRCGHVRVHRIRKSSCADVEAGRTRLFCRHILGGRNLRSRVSKAIKFFFATLWDADLELPKPTAWLLVILFSSLTFLV